MVEKLVLRAESRVLRKSQEHSQPLSVTTRYFLRHQRRANHRAGIRLLECFVDLCQGKGMRDEFLKRIALEVAPHEIQRLRDYPRLIGGKRHQSDAAEHDASSL